jgi:putative acetyltransferase
MIKITLGDLDDRRVIDLLHFHFTTARAQTPPESAHALDLTGLRAPDIGFWTAWEGERLLGIGALRRLSADHGEVKSMHTAEAARRKGVGAAMLRHIVEEARRAGMVRLSLETGSSAYFRPAVELYRSHGFVECAPFSGYKPDPHSIFMSLELAKS